MNGEQFSVTKPLQTLDARSRRFWLRIESSDL
jgi:hypothetical protein